MLKSYYNQKAFCQINQDILNLKKPKVRKKKSKRRRGKNAKEKVKFKFIAQKYN